MPTRDGYALDSLADFVKAAFECGTVHLGRDNSGPRIWPPERSFEAGTLYCPRCGDFRRMRFLRVDPEANWAPKGPDNAEALLLKPFLLSCLQCDAATTAVVYPGVEGRPALALLPGVMGGLGTPNTPPSVRFYLDQAHRSKAMGAHSATMAMYRAALDQLMHQQGYKDGMLGQKVQQLVKDRDGGTGPKWVRDLEPDFLRVLNQLGNGAIHPNDGDVSKQEAIDSELLRDVQTTFAELLHLIYERDAERAARLAKLQSRAEVVKK